MSFKEERLRSGKTVAETMKAIGVSDAAIYSWEAGVYRPRASLLQRIASFYGCTIDSLLDGNPTVSQNTSDNTDSDRP